MARDFFTNQGSTTVSSGGTTAPAAGSSESWTVASSSTFPAASNATNPASQFYVSDPALPSETILVTNVSGTTWTVTRGADNTTPVAHTSGFTVRNVVSATWLQSLDDKVKWQTLNVKDYLAKGDNFTNDQPAIQAAIDDAWKAGGGQVIVPRGIYRIMSAATSSSPLKMRSNVRLTLLPGAEIHRYANPSAASLVWAGDFSQGLAVFNGQRNMVIEGGIWDMRNSSATNSLATDNFTRANTAAPHTLGATSGGSQTWIDETSADDGTSTSGNLGINTNLAYNPSARTGISTIYGWPDGTTSVVVNTANTTGQTGLVFRVENGLNFWQFTRDGSSGNARLSYWANGVETVVTPTSTQAVAAGATLTVTCIGSRIVAGVITSGTYALSHDTTDVAGYSANRKAGLVITDTTSRLATFSSAGSIWADTFTRANSATSLGTTSSGYAWTSRSGTLGINTNLAYAPGAGTNISTVDVTSETNPTVTVSTVGTALNGLVFRYIDNNNYWYYARNAAGNAELAKVVAGTTTIITPGTTQAVANGNVLSVSVIGYEITASVGATQTHSVNNDSSNYAGTKAGIIINDTTARLSAFDTPAAWGQSSGACFSFSHTTNVVWRDTTIRDTHQNSHSIDMQGLKDTLVDNVRFLGCVGNQQRGAVQIDSSINDGLPPLDSTATQNLTIRGCTVAQSYSAGTVAYPRGFEAHAARVTQWYKNIRIVDNHFEVLERAVRGYNWNNGVISNNTIASGWGIEYRPIWTSNTSDTTNRAGTQTSASQAIQGVTITGNMIDGTGSSAGSTDAAIRVFGETTGHVQDVCVTGNVIVSTPSIAISLEWIDRGTCSGNTIVSPSLKGINVSNCTDVNVSNNTIYNAGTLAIDVGATSDSLIQGNRIHLAGTYGIYIEGGSARNTIVGNAIKGASRTTNAGTGAMAVSGNASNLDNCFMSNRVQKEGSGNEASFPFVKEGGTANTGNVLVGNSFRGWSATHSSNVSITGSATVDFTIAAATTANNCQA